MVDMSSLLLLHHQKMAASHCTMVWWTLPGVLETALELQPNPAPFSFATSLESFCEQMMVLSGAGWWCSWQYSPGDTSSSLVSGLFLLPP